MKLKINPINEFTCFGSIESLFIDHVVTLQRHEYFCSCNPSCITSRALLTIEKLGQSFLFSFNSYDCIHCNTDLNITCKFVKKPFLLFIQIVGLLNINDLPNELIVEDSSYHFLFSVFHKGNKRNINLIIALWGPLQVEGVIRVGRPDLLFCLSYRDLQNSL